MEPVDFGMVGLGVMGRNLALNIAEKGFSVAGWDAWPDPVDALTAAGGGAKVTGFKALGDFVGALRRPRRIILLVKAGEVVDQTLAALAPLLESGDIVVDGGNEFFENTERRAAALKARGLRYFGMGISGGEEGARHGPSLMPGGERAAYDALEPILTRVAAQADGPCVTYVGPGGSGHFVKMVHNGIEYGDMQLIAEAYDLLKSLAGLSNPALADTFAAWNQGELESYLIDITSRIFRQRDALTGAALVDVIKDAAAQKGTGKWTVEQAAELGVAAPTLAAAVDARLLSADRSGRAAGRALVGPTPATGARVDEVRQALFCAKAASYAQGMSVLAAASAEHGWELRLSELARIWTGGCIIRARFLKDIKEAFGADPQLPNLLVAPWFREQVSRRQAAWRTVVATAALQGVPTPAFSSALAYYDTLRRTRLPASLIQAQRDFFGAHTFERTDREGSFHVHWES